MQTASVASRCRTLPGKWAIRKQPLSAPLNRTQPQTSKCAFTPTAEVDFCGHATLATFSLLWKQQTLSAGNYIQATGAGLLKVSITENGQVSMDQQLPEFLQTFSADVIAPY
nr:PhzF family phenazine biosynthesis protein [Aliamphritea spongicola]